jgi:hypothetical protein
MSAETNMFHGDRSCGSVALSTLAMGGVGSCIGSGSTASGPAVVGAGSAPLPCIGAGVSVRVPDGADIDGAEGARSTASLGGFVFGPNDGAEGPAGVETSWAPAGTQDRINNPIAKSDVKTLEQRNCWPPLRRAEHAPEVTLPTRHLTLKS